jgi:hypothetical protein
MWLFLWEEMGVISGLRRMIQATQLPTIFLMLLLIVVPIFWAVRPSCYVIGYHRFGGSCYFHLQREIWTAWSFETLVSHITTRRHKTEAGGSMDL